MAIQNIKGGDRILITLKDGSKKEGIFMPNEETNNVVLKLDSGYNIGIATEHISSMEILELKKEIKKEKIKITKNLKLPTITILHTGGTIASKVDYSSGAVTASFTAEDLIKMVPKIQDIANIESELVANMMSEDMRFSHYQLLADAVEKHIKNGVKGIIIGHGTDTLGYTSAALSFMLENVPIPVILVGSQRSSDRPSSDAKENLLFATRFIVETDFTGVAVCMHENSSDSSCVILPGTKTRKNHTSRRDAFKAINGKPIARITPKSVEILDDYSKEDSEFIVKKDMNPKVAIIKTYPNITSEIFEMYEQKEYKGLIIEGTGLGHAPTNIKENIPIYDSLKRFIANGGIVGITSQCINGRVHPYVYTNLRRLKDIGCVFCEDMITETAYIKLAWLLANNSENAKDLLNKNLRGEITDRSEFFQNN